MGQSKFGWLQSLVFVVGSVLCFAVAAQNAQQECSDMYPADAYEHEERNLYIQECVQAYGGYEDSYQEPSYQEPSYQEPSYQEPSYQEPSYEEPSYQEPSYEDTSTQSFESGDQGYYEGTVEDYVNNISETEAAE